MSDTLSNDSPDTGRLWQFIGHGGHRFRCDVLTYGEGWVVWYVVDGQRIGCDHFADHHRAINWGWQLFRELGGTSAIANDRPDAADARRG
jgi:hypothetical protein